jgi:hypothetical protein
MKINQTKKRKMRNFIIIVLGFFVFTCAHAQNKIKGASNFPVDTVDLSKRELNQLINSSYILCAKIDPFNRSHVVKTLEIQCADINSNFGGAYIESNEFLIGDIKLAMGQMKPITLIAACVIVDRNGICVTYELDQEGRRLFDNLLSNTTFGYQ